MAFVCLKHSRRDSRKQKFHVKHSETLFAMHTSRAKLEASPSRCTLPLLGPAESRRALFPWSKQVKNYFQPHEFKCRCKRPECDAPPMRPAFLQKLNALRHEWGEPLAISSGSRCAFWNAKVGGSGRSQHMAGNAADIIMRPQDAAHFAELASRIGMGGVAIGKNFVHVDDGPKRTWSYV